MFLNEPDIVIDENFILPKSLHLCMIRFEGDIAWYMELDMKKNQACAREEREADARQEEKTASEKLQTPTGLSGPRNTGLSGRTENFAKEN